MTLTSVSRSVRYASTIPGATGVSPVLLSKHGQDARGTRRNNLRWLVGWGATATIFRRSTAIQRAGWGAIRTILDSA